MLRDTDYSKLKRSFEFLVQRLIPPHHLTGSDPIKALERNEQRERPLANQVAERCITLWYDVLSDRRNYQEEKSIYLDTTQVYFFVWLAPHAPLTAWTHAWEEKKARAGKLLGLSEALVSYIDGTLSEAKLVAYLTRAEKMIKASK